MATPCVLKRNTHNTQHARRWPARLWALLAARYPGAAVRLFNLAQGMMESKRLGAEHAVAACSDSAVLRGTCGCLVLSHEMGAQLSVTMTPACATHSSHEAYPNASSCVGPPLPWQRRQLAS